MTPWQLAGPSEHSQQRALFAWMNCAALYGFGPANHADTYNLKTRQDVLDAFAISGQLTGQPCLPIPELAFAFAIHNQGHGDIVRGGRAKAEGVKAGAPDLMLPVPRRGSAPLGYTVPTLYCGLFIEMKKPSAKPKRETSAGGVSKKQAPYHEFLMGQGYCVKVCYGWEEARAEIVEYMR